MALVVQKYGGTSVGTPERIRRVAQRVAREKQAGNDVVVVVSAMGDTTDDLAALAEQVTGNARRRHPREFDMLLTAGERIAMSLVAMAIRDCGCDAVSLTGSQAAIITDEAHTVARIAEVRGTRVREEIAQGRVVIVAGFQGVSRTREVTTLGRGGSDTTAVALAAALGAGRCEIFTDVDGIYSADPRRIPDARLIEQIDYQEAIELTTAGAQVMHPRAVEIGARYDVPIRVRSSFRDDPGYHGTLITRRSHVMEELALTGLASERGNARITLRGVPAGMNVVATLLNRLAARGISVDLVNFFDRPDGRRQIQVTVDEGDQLDEARGICHALLEEQGGEQLETETGLSRVALVGSGMHGTPGVYARAFQVLVEAGVDVLALSTSSISITFLVRTADEDRTLQLLHRAFGLGTESQ
ncbi:MAG TPA: aspartate kinase [Longimicrobiales bacterium]|nr:aspartate kinase [Longimicrobiales bacterium]